MGRQSQERDLWSLPHHHDVPEGEGTHDLEGEHLPGAATEPLLEVEPVEGTPRVGPDVEGGTGESLR